MNPPLDPRWQDALALSRYLTTLFAARPELVGRACVFPVHQGTGRYAGGPGL